MSSTTTGYDCATQFVHSGGRLMEDSNTVGKDSGGHLMENSNAVGGRHLIEDNNMVSGDCGG